MRHERFDLRGSQRDACYFCHQTWPCEGELVRHLSQAIRDWVVDGDAAKLISAWERFEADSGPIRA
jgi:hypothetical protein